MVEICELLVILKPEGAFHHLQHVFLLTIRQLWCIGNLHKALVDIIPYIAQTDYKPLFSLELK